MWELEVLVNTNSLRQAVNVSVALARQLKQVDRQPKKTPHCGKVTSGVMDKIVGPEASSGLLVQRSSNVN